jgi:hypothetical protein
MTVQHLGENTITIIRSAAAQKKYKKMTDTNDQTKALHA